MELSSIALAFGLTIFAGLSTGIGSTLAFFTRRTNTRFLAIALGFSAGVMMYVSMAELLGEARSALVKQLGLIPGAWATAVAFFGGVLIIGLIDKFIPSCGNPHEPRLVEEMRSQANCPCAQQMASGHVPDLQRLMRTGLLSAVAIAVHNFPEGIAAFTTAWRDPSLGIPIALAVALHNIPEGIAVSVPIYYATGQRSRAFWYSLLSGLSEPLGALLGYLILAPLISDALMGALLAAVAGIMVFISVDELLPAAREYGEHHLSVYGLIAGMAVMNVSLILFG